MSTSPTDPDYIERLFRQFQREAFQCKLSQRALHVGWCLGATQVRRQPIEMKIFRAGTFWWARAEVGVLQQCAEQGRDDGAARCPFAVAIKRFSLVLGDPGVHQGIARACIPACDITARRYQADVGDAANVHHCSGDSLADQSSAMKGRHQWRALATCGHVPASEIADHRNAGKFGQPIRVADL